MERKTPTDADQAEIKSPEALRAKLHRDLDQYLDEQVESRVESELLMEIRRLRRLEKAQALAQAPEALNHDPRDDRDDPGFGGMSEKKLTPESNSDKEGKDAKQGKKSYKKADQDSEEDSEKDSDDDGDDKDDRDDKEVDKDKDEGTDDDKKDDKKSGSSKKKKKKFEWTPKKVILFAIVAALLLAGIIYFLWERHTYETTDDALIEAHTAMLSPKVGGIVTQVLVDEHEHVKAGQLLVTIEKKDYLAQMAAARANFESSQVQYENSKRDFGRSSALLKDHAITRQSYDHAFADYQDNQRRMNSAQANLDQAKLNLEYTELRAPTDGMIGRKSVEVGTNAQAGTALLGFVQNEERWVMANFKETQLEFVQPGRQVKIKVDAIKDRDFSGVIESLSPSSGATFTLFPPDNATGNFTKVVQRVPVRIMIENLSAQDRMLLQAGLNAVVKVVKHSELKQLPASPSPQYTSQTSQEQRNSDAKPAETPTPKPSSENDLKQLENNL